MSRILVAGIHHESNTFSPILTGIEDFSIQRGTELFDFLNKSDSISGIVDTLREAGHEVVPSLLARAVPNGVVEKKLYLQLKEELLARAEAGGPYDGIVLAIHGSMRVEGIGEAEGDFLPELRRMFPDIPISASLDMHATMTEAMIQSLDALVGYKQAPHTDCWETGRHAARMLLKIMEEGRRPIIGWCRIPLLIAGEKSETSVEPMRELIEVLREYETREGIMAASYLLGFPWADCRENGVSVLVVADSAGKAARMSAEKATRELALRFWEKRESFQFHTDTYEEDEAVATLFELVEKGDTPVYLSDSGDNPTAGSSSDCTGLLEKVLSSEGLARSNRPVLYAGIYDPAAVRHCFEVGVGGFFDMAVGATFDRVTSSPLPLVGRVVSLVSCWERFSADMALIDTGSVNIILVSKHIGFVTPDMFTALGRGAEYYSAIVIKLGYLTAPHKSKARKSIMALSKGSSNEVLESLPYRELQRPVFPLDREIDFEPDVFIQE